VASASVLNSLVFASGVAAFMAGFIAGAVGATAGAAGTVAAGAMVELGIGAMVPPVLVCAKAAGAKPRAHAKVNAGRCLVNFIFSLL
jgi:hypothetical protein